jgi:hypothetical protein
MGSIIFIGSSFQIAASHRTISSRYAGSELQSKLGQIAGVVPVMSRKIGTSHRQPQFTQTSCKNTTARGFCDAH